MEMRSYAAALGIFFHVTLLGMNCHATDHELDVAIATMERQESELGPIEVAFEFVTRVDVGNPIASPVEARLIHRQCVDGARRRLETMGVMDVTRPELKQDLTTVFTGQRQNSFDRTRQHGAIGLKGGFPHDYFAAAYLFPEGLLARLKKNRPQLIPTRDTVGGKNTLRVSWLDKEAGTEMVVWLDAARFYQPAQLIIDSPIPSGMFPDDRNRGVYRLVVSDYWLSERAALPSQVRTTYEMFWPDGKHRLVNDKTLKVKDVKRNVAFASEEFELVFPPGATVTDLERQVTYVEGKAGSEQRLAQSPPENTTRSSSLGGFGIHWLWIGIGLILVAIGVFRKIIIARQ